MVAAPAFFVTMVIEEFLTTGLVTGVGLTIITMQIRIGNRMTKLETIISERFKRIEQDVNEFHKSQQDIGAMKTAIEMLKKDDNGLGDKIRGLVEGHSELKKKLDLMAFDRQLSNMANRGRS